MFHYRRVGIFHGIRARNFVTGSGSVARRGLIGWSGRHGFGRILLSLLDFKSAVSLTHGTVSFAYPDTDLPFDQRHEVGLRRTRVIRVYIDKRISAEQPFSSRGARRMRQPSRPTVEPDRLGIEGRCNITAL